MYVIVHRTKTYVCDLQIDSPRVHVTIYTRTYVYQAKGAQSKFKAKSHKETINY